jgi:glycine cleavage system H protein
VEIPEQLRYAENHEWAKLEGDRVRVGITDYAQDALGDIVYVELPDVGRELAAGEAFGEIESTKSVSDVYAPVAGTVVEVNSALDDNPEVINGDPYGDGWMLMLEVAPGTTLDGLMDAAAYEGFTAE